MRSRDGATEQCGNYRYEHANAAFEEAYYCGLCVNESQFQNSRPKRYGNIFQILVKVHAFKCFCLSE